ncbi:MAG: hypothetical protein B6244_10035 [Candidatus Cloacimonetes bacterium 4572_55]|nr:MAG: hypothetical protein B6244_10035 [Candidatus Cloacimonetes bacterium 4572_55]
MMKKYAILTLIWTLCLSVVSLHAEDQSPYFPGQLLIQTAIPTGESVDRDEASAQAAEQLAQDFDAIDLSPRTRLSRRLHIWLFDFNPIAVEAEHALEMVKSHPAVAMAQFNHHIEQRQTIPNDPRFPDMWGLNNTGQSGGIEDADIDAPEAWDITVGGVSALGDTIVAAVIDGGFDLDHEDLAPNFWKNWAEIPNNGVDDDNNGYVDDFHGWNAYDNNGNLPESSHGTHVAGTVGAVGDNNIGVTGVNWQVKMMPIAGSTGNESIAVTAYGYVLEMRARYNETDGAEGAFVVSTNASFGVNQGQPENFPLWCAIYDSLGRQGVLSCGATANASFDIDQVGDIPTACPSDYLISVTNTTHNDQRNSGAAYGATTIDLGAPGTDIMSTVPGNGYDGSYTGTSMATPHVTGAVALLYAAAGSAMMHAYRSDPAEIALVMRDYLLDGVDPIPSLEGQTVTGGRLNLYNAALNVGGYTSALFVGVLSSAETDEPISDEQILARNANDASIFYLATTDNNGLYQLSIEPGDYTLHAVIQGYSHFQSVVYSVADEDTLVVNIEMEYTGDAPQNLTTESGLNSHVPLSWQAPLNSVSFHIYRSTESGGPYERIDTVETTEYDDSDVRNGHTYFYAITANYEEPDGESFYSDESSATPGEIAQIPYMPNFDEERGAMYQVVMDQGNGDGALWEFGIIDPGHGPGGSDSDSVWAVGIDENYANNADIYLITPFLDLSDAIMPRLMFDHWYEFEGTSTRGFDGGNVAVSSNAGDDWIVIEPEQGYDDAGIPGLDQEPGFSGSSSEWASESFDLSQFISRVISIRFRFGADAGVSKAGWFLDNLMVQDGDAVEDDAPTSSSWEYGLSQNYPNPFYPTTEIRFQLPVADQVKIHVYNTAGQLVKRLMDRPMTPGQHSIAWNGHNEQGADV